MRRWWPNRALLAKMMPFAAALLIGVLGFLMGRAGRGPAKANLSRTALEPPRLASDSDYDKRVVAYIYDNIPITREELGEFLIERFGPERLEMLVTRRIVELACRSRGIQITDAQIEAQLDMELKTLSPNGVMTRKDFANQILRPRNRTLYEYKEDVLRPKLMLAALVGPTVKVTDEDVRKAFEARYGPRVECRMIVLPDNNHKFQIWEKIKDSEPEFDRAARTLNHPQLAALNGRVPPIHKHFGDPRIEEAAFKLKVGEVSGLIPLPDKTVAVLKCDRHLPPDPTKRLEDERLALMTEIENQKLAQRVQEEMANLRKRANPKLLLRREQPTDEVEHTASPGPRGQATAAPSPPPRIDMPAVPKSSGS
ncbi:MAG: peptidylprolyl isomerase [Gemmataceae bacterium]|nr:peptidylprolyl isomerase [Gemmataceae bacterium]